MTLTTIRMSINQKNMTIKTKRLVLRPFRPDDADTAHEYAGDLETTKYMIHLPNRTRQETAEFIQKTIAEWEKEKPSFYEFAVVCGDKHIGGVSIYLDESGREGEIGWIINKTYQGNGYATEAAKAVLDFAVHTLKVKKITAHCDYRNEPSRRVMRKIGLSPERGDGVRRYKDSDEDVPELMCSKAF